MCCSGETASLGRRTFVLAPGRVEVDDGAHLIVVEAHLVEDL